MTNKPDAQASFLAELSVVALTGRICYASRTIPPRRSIDSSKQEKSLQLGRSY
jgi:hypothetical protein